MLIYLILYSNANKHGSVSVQMKSFQLMCRFKLKFSGLFSSAIKQHVNQTFSANQLVSKLKVRFMTDRFVVCVCVCVLTPPPCCTVRPPSCRDDNQASRRFPLRPLPHSSRSLSRQTHTSSCLTHTHKHRFQSHDFDVPQHKHS